MGASFLREVSFCPVAIPTTRHLVLYIKESYTITVLSHSHSDQEVLRLIEVSCLTEDFCPIEAF